MMRLATTMSVAHLPPSKIDKRSFSIATAHLIFPMAVQIERLLELGFTSLEARSWNPTFATSAGPLTGF